MQLNLLQLIIKLNSTLQYDAYYDEYQQRAQHILLQRQALEAFQATLELFQDQVSMSQHYFKTYRLAISGGISYLRLTK